MPGAMLGRRARPALRNVSPPAGRDRGSGLTSVSAAHDGCGIHGVVRRVRGGRGMGDAEPARDARHGALWQPSFDGLACLQLGMGWLPEQAGNGLDRVFHALLNHLPGAGMTAHGLVAGSDDVGRQTGGRVRAFARPGAPLPLRLAAMRRAARQALASQPPDLVAAHFAPYALPVLDLLGERPLVVHFHGPWALESRAEGAGALAVRTKAWVERRVYRQGRLFVVLSDSFGAVLRESYGIDPGRIRVIPGGVEADRFDTGLSRHEARERLGWSLDRPILLAVRRLQRRTGLDALLEAFAILRRRRPDAVLLVAGSGAMEGALQAAIEAAGLGEHARLLGQVPDRDLPLAYRAADLSVVPSVALEGFGLVTAESLAAGTPVLVTPVGGLPEAVRGLSPDLVLADATPGGIAAGLIEALDGKRALPGSEECRRYARQRFAWPAIARRTREVYEEALHG